MGSATDISKHFESKSPAKRLRDAQERLLRDDQGDMTVRCGDQSWKCFSAILAQRCAFFRAATLGGFMESETRTVTLADETNLEVEMLLLYLYTLDDPNFKDKASSKSLYSPAISALKLGDKYDLPDLGAAAQRHISQYIRRSLANWPDKTDEVKQSWISRLAELWTIEYRGVTILREVAMKRIVQISKDIVAYAPFQKLCLENPEFALTFIQGLATELHGLQDGR